MSSEGLSPQLTDGHLLLVSPHGLPSVCVCVLIYSSYKDTSNIELEPTLLTSFSLNYFFKGSISKQSHIMKYWRLGLRCMNGGRGVQFIP